MKNTLKRQVTLKDGRSFAKGSNVAVKFLGDKDFGSSVCEITVEGIHTFKTRIVCLPNTVTGFTMPSRATLEKWAERGIAKTPTGKTTEPDGYAYDGSPSWLLAFGVI